ncbi:MAG: tRNA (N(6)-L-threonylcarbamoyladenosine(37)-C(2))-methylthiotransferase MtaB [Candidatus Margulisiibacteriota bacterium]
MTQTISFYNQGCRLNQAETSVLEQSFLHRGYTVVPFAKPADIVVVNTCTVTENGDADTRRLVNKINRQNPEAKIALVGCQAQVLKEVLLQLPGVRWVVGNTDKMRLPDIFERPSETPQLLVSKIKRETFTQETPGIHAHHTRANIKIQDGCDFYCSFCVIPFARGPARSRQFDDILKEVKVLAEHGHKEVVLTGINLGTYQDGAYSVTDVIQGIAAEPGIARIRISSIEPTTIPKAVIQGLGQGKTKLCRYAHVPLQSGSDTILKAMSRHYSVAEFEAILNDIHAEMPEGCIGTDVIVGFPGETDDLFAETVETLKRLPLDYFHVFSYSERKLARSSKLADQVPADIIHRRSETLRHLSDQKRQAFMTRQLGKTEWVLFEQQKNGLWTGLTDHYIRVFVDSSEALSNQLLPVKLESVSDKGMMGTVVAK